MKSRHAVHLSNTRSQLRYYRSKIQRSAKRAQKKPAAKKLLKKIDIIKKRYKQLHTQTRIIQDTTLISLIGTFSSIYTMLQLTDFKQSGKPKTQDREV